MIFVSGGKVGMQVELESARLIGITGGKFVDLVR